MRSFLYFVLIVFAVQLVGASCINMYVDLSRPAWVDVRLYKASSLTAEASNTLLDFALIVYTSDSVFKVDDGFQGPEVYDMESIDLEPGSYRVAVESQSSRGWVRVCADGEVSKRENKEEDFVSGIIHWMLSLFGF